MRQGYNRLADWGDRTNKGSRTLQTSGQLAAGPTAIEGVALSIKDWSLHSYQVITTGEGTWDGEFQIEVSNDGENYTNIYSQTFSDASGLAYCDTWTFAYARPIISGNAGGFLINERHLG